MSDNLGQSIHKPLSQIEVTLEANRCLYCYDAPCMNACPTHIDVASFIQKISTGNIKGSAATIMDANAMGASCARVCPTEELCEGACVYNAAGDSPIRIGDLQRYALDYVAERDIQLFEPGPDTGKRVAIIGGGPAGLATARDLRRFGHAVTIFEAKDQLGGLNTYGIVPFRLSVETALWEAEQVVKLGLDVRTNVRVGVDVTIDDLTRDFDAVVLACGMGNVPKLGIEGENLEGVWDALDFIERAKLGKPIPDLGTRVAVIGAGNTAIDALTCAKRLSIARGKEAQVICFYRRGAEQMTAYQFEYDFAKEEGIEFRFFCAPVRIVSSGEDNTVMVSGASPMRPVEPRPSEGEGRVAAVEFVKTELRGGKLTPVAGSEFTERIDTVISAIGQSRLTETFDRLGIAHHDGVVRVDESLQTSRPGVWAAGDCIFEKGMREAMVVEVAQQGKLAARSIDAYLKAGVLV